MRLPDGFLDELKARARPSLVIGKKVKLQKRGKEWVGLSPFTNEKTPSFYVNDQKQMFKCFSSGLGGDVIKFVMETERLGFMEAVERIAGEIGMAIPTASPEIRERYNRLDHLKSICKAAQNFFVERLKSADGATARQYLADKRGLGPDAWARHGIGYAPADWRQLFAHLTGNGVSADDIIAAGLAKRSDKGGEPYDVFRNRVIFPITDLHGDVIAFGGRALDPEDKAKYLNSPETELFHKSSVVYNYRRAREAIGYGERGGLIVCEGYMDVIALHEAGFRNAVAPLGTALTPQQLAMVWKAGPDPILCFDGDGAGLRAAYRAIDVALPHLQPDKSVFVCLLPEKMDPDDLLKSEDGQERMAALLAEPKPLIEMLWRRERDAEPLDTPERLAGLSHRLRQAAKNIQHSEIRDIYSRSLYRLYRQYTWEKDSRSKAPNSLARCKETLSPEIAAIIKAIKTPQFLDENIEAVFGVEFADKTSNDICDIAAYIYNSGDELTVEKVLSLLRKKGKTDAIRKIKSLPHLEPINMTNGEDELWQRVLRMAKVREGEETKRVELFRLKAEIAEKWNALEGSEESPTGWIDEWYDRVSKECDAKRRV